MARPLDARDAARTALEQAASAEHPITRLAALVAGVEAVQRYGCARQVAALLADVQRAVDAGDTGARARCLEDALRSALAVPVAAPAVLAGGLRGAR